MKIFDVDKIPEFRRNELADLALDLTRALFEQPGEEAKYQAWLKQRKQQQPAAKGGGRPNDK